jgi:lantibiotic leader peptide-processing serine protease
MKIQRILLFGALVAVLAAWGVVQPTSLASNDTLAARQPDEDAGRFLVEYSGRIDPVVAAVQAAGGQVGRVHPSIGALEVEGLEAQTLTELPGVQHATPDIVLDMLADYPRRIPPFEDPFFPVTAAAYELDPASRPNLNPDEAYFFGCQWNMQQVKAPEAWATGARGAGMRIAVVDTGIQHDHIDLVGKVDLTRSANFLTVALPGCPLEDRRPDLLTDYAGHGTMVASVVTSNNIGVGGVAPDATLVMVKVLGCTGGGSALDVIAGILYAAELDVDVISLSLAFTLPRSASGGGRFVALFQKAVNYATQQGKLLVGSAGNDARDLGKMKDVVRIPTMLANVRTAYATDHRDQLAPYSSYGTAATWVGAPGGFFWDYEGPALPGCAAVPAVQNRIPMACSGDTIRRPFSDWCKNGSTSTYLTRPVGTSFATPMVAGVAALVGGTRNRGFNPQQIATILAQTADDLGDPGVDNYYSHGRVNAARAVQRR